jgi:hypothetical protein
MSAYQFRCRLYFSSPVAYQRSRDAPITPANAMQHKTYLIEAY